MANSQPIDSAPSIWCCCWLRTGAAYKRVSCPLLSRMENVHQSIMHVRASASALLLIALAGKALPMLRVRAPDMAGV